MSATGGTGPAPADGGRPPAARTWVVPLLLAVLAGSLVLAGAAYKRSCSGTPQGQYIDRCYNDISPLWHAERLDEGAVPYLDHPVEYPVLTGAQMWVSAQPADDGVSFFWWTVPWLVGGAAAAAWILTREVGWRAAALAASPVLVLSGAINWDLPTLALAAGGLVAHRRGRDVAAGVLLGLGVAMKLWPGLLLVPIVPAAWAARGRIAGVRTAVAAAGSWAVVNVPVMVVAFDGWWRFWELNRERGVNFDSLWYVADQYLGFAPGGSTVNLLAAAMVLGATVAVLVATVRRAPPARWHHAAIVVLAVFLVTNKVYSPQYTLWMLPLLAVSFPGWGWVAAVGVADLAVHVTEWPYLANFVDGTTEGWPLGPFALALVVRAAVLVGAALAGWWRATADDGAPEPDRPEPVPALLSR